MPQSARQPGVPDADVAVKGISTNEDGVTLHVSAGIIAFRLPQMKHALIIKHRANNQWSFPKGHVEDFDSSLEDTALREFEEETGILKGSVELLPGWSEATEFDYRSHDGKWQRKTVLWFCGVCSEGVEGKEMPETIACKWEKMASLWGKLRRREAMAVARKAAKAVQRHFGDAVATEDECTVRTVQATAAQDHKSEDQGHVVLAAAASAAGCASSDSTSPP